MELGIDYVSSVGGDKGRTAIRVPSGPASRGCLRPISGQNGTDRFFKQIQRLKNANSRIRSSIPSVGGLEGSLSYVGVTTFQKDQSWFD
ncbi:unnamed protein product [Clonostachys byssicola]|uniref:Uncharacterized protein n=1 Tax=Clonostachys byssicola TaxID=160290 RepID=A0A9N9UE64_9HYPO|nr:unnamed protein product [Clonostachys byssicola]